MKIRTHQSTDLLYLVVRKWLFPLSLYFISCFTIHQIDDLQLLDRSCLICNSCMICNSCNSCNSWTAPAHPEVIREVFIVYGMNISLNKENRFFAKVHDQNPALAKNEGLARTNSNFGFTPIRVRICSILYRIAYEVRVENHGPK
jgi:hypothetical protein